MIATTQYENVLQIKMSRYPDFPTAGWVCAHLVEGLLIDTGPAYTAGELTEFLKDKDVKIAVNTHFHEDHISANKFLQDAYNTEIFAHPLAVDKINKPAKLYPYQEEVWGYPVPSQVKPVGDCIVTKDYRFDVISTPGHDLDHICLFEKKMGWLFTGDLYVTTRPVVCRPNDDMWRTLDDLKKLRALNPRIIFPAPTHVVKEPNEKLDKLIAYLLELGNKIDELYNRGMNTAQIRQEVFGEESFIANATQQQFSSLNMVKSFLRKYEKRNG
ncbi:MAG: MBL fold metallo-hydrolase [Chloroflexi bacterium]|nr:MBL fold metallo-hydrolase [Chloroflexota bacterium]